MNLTIDYPVIIILGIFGLCGYAIYKTHTLVANWIKERKELGEL